MWRIFFFFAFVFIHTEQKTTKNFSPNISPWIDEFQLNEFFDFSWFFTGAFQWHLKQMFWRRSIGEQREQSHNFTDIFSHLFHHVERGVFIDTKIDPFRSIFPSPPRTAFSLRETCQQLNLTEEFYPCRLRPEEYRSAAHDFRQPPFSYGLYDVFIQQTIRRNSIEHYDELIYLFDYSFEPLTRLLFIQHYLPRLIRLIAVAPSSAMILVPFSTRKIDFVRQYLTFLERRSSIVNRTRFIRFHPQTTYHAHIVYSTSSPRFDLLLLHRLLFDRFQTYQQEFILILRRSISSVDFQEILQTIQLFEFPIQFQHLRIYPFDDSDKFDLHQIRHVFPRSFIVIGQSSEDLSQIVWCLPSTHIIEIARQNLTAEIYEMTIQLSFHYWLARTINDGRLDVTDFRQLFLQLLTSISDQ